MVCIPNWQTLLDEIFLVIIFLEFIITSKCAHNFGKCFQSEMEQLDDVWRLLRINLIVLIEVSQPYCI